MTFIDAWFVWFLALSQPTVPNTATVHPTGVVNAVARPAPQVHLRSNVGWSTPQPTKGEISGRGEIREAHGISNGY